MKNATAYYQFYSRYAIQNFNMLKVRMCRTTTPLVVDPVWKFQKLLPGVSMLR